MLPRSLPSDERTPSIISYCALVSPKTSRVPYKPDNKLLNDIAFYGIPRILHDDATVPIFIPHVRMTKVALEGTKTRKCMLELGTVGESGVI